MIRVVLAESQASVREVMLRVLQADPEIDVVGTASTGADALRLTKQLRPSAVVMAVRMPTLDGFEAAKQIMIETPTPIVLVASNPGFPELELSAEALRAGALALVSVPPQAAGDGAEAAQRQFTSTIKALSQVKVVRRWRERTRPESRESSPARGTPARIVAVAASTGGPAALQAILSQLPATFPTPIMVVQHISTGFINDFVTWMNNISLLTVKIATEGEGLAASTVYVAPDDRHLGVAAGHRVLLSSAAPVGGFRPSATFLFESVAKAFGSAALGVILTGMGSDGVDGLRCIQAARGTVVAQDESSSVVFGMPRAAIEAGVVNRTLTLADITSELLTMVQAAREA